MSKIIIFFKMTIGSCKYTQVAKFWGFLFKRALFPKYILAQQKNTRTHRMHLFLVFVFVEKKYLLSVSVRPSVRPSCRPSSVRPSVSMSFCGNLISNSPIDTKIGLNVGYGVVHVRNA